MSIQQTSKYCRRCKRYTLHARPREAIGCIAGLMCTVFTLGLFFPFWVLATMFPPGKGPYRCQVCGRKYGSWYFG